MFSMRRIIQRDNFDAIINNIAMYAGLRNFRYKIVNTKSVLYSQKKVTSEKRSKIKKQYRKSVPKR